MTLRFAAGGGQPPQSHEVLRLDPGGDGRYLTGMPWPSQRPFDEIGVYVATTDLGRLAELARAVLAAPPPGGGHADAGGESVELDGAPASWGARDGARRPRRSSTRARAAIGAAREHPLAAVRARRGGRRARPPAPRRAPARRRRRRGPRRPRQARAPAVAAPARRPGPLAVRPAARARPRRVGARRAARAAARRRCGTSRRRTPSSICAGARRSRASRTSSTAG